MAVLIDGDAMTFRAAAYGRPSEEKIQFLNQQFTDPSRFLNIANQRYVERARTLFEDSYGDEAMARYDSVRRNLQRAWDLDDIRPLTTIEQQQAAKPRMQRWVMANPYLRGLYKQGRIAGYGDSYLDHKRQGIGPEHYDYRVAMSGFATYNDDDGWTATTYMEELLPGDETPSFGEQIDIFDTWCQAEHFLQVGRRDVTSPEDSEWG